MGSPISELLTLENHQFACCAKRGFLGERQHRAVSTTALTVVFSSLGEYSLPWASASMRDQISGAVPGPLYCRQTSWPGLLSAERSHSLPSSNFHGQGNCGNCRLHAARNFPICSATSSTPQVVSITSRCNTSPEMGSLR